MPGPDHDTSLARLADDPKLARVIAHLQPSLLHRVITHVGLEDAGALIALATPAQLTQVLDLDLWRPARAGLDEGFDPERFGVWLEVLLDAGGSFAARTLAALDRHVVTAGFSAHVRVLDLAALPMADADTGEVFDNTRAGDGEWRFEIGGYRVIARRTDAWDAVVAALIALEAEQPACFDEIMRGCRRLSHEGLELDGLDDLMDDRAQALYDVAGERADRRGREGFLAPADARAFLESARRADAAASATANPVVAAYFRMLDAETARFAAAGDTSDDLPAGAEAVEVEAIDVEAIDTAVSEVVEILSAAGVLPRQPRALLHAGEHAPSRLPALETWMAAHDAPSAARDAIQRDLAFLSNALVAGCPIQGRAFTAAEASDGVAATCNLGLERWPTASADESDSAPHLVAAFTLGWRVLYEEVCLATAKATIGTLDTLECADPVIRRELHELRRSLARHTAAGRPWLARDDLDVLTGLDLPAWAGLLGLLDECPTLHAAVAAGPGARVLRVDPTAFAFIADAGQIAAAHAFVAALPLRLSGV